MNERMGVTLPYLRHLPILCGLFLLSFQIALETLLLKGPQKPRTHPLADYRYTGDWREAAGMLGPG